MRDGVKIKECYCSSRSMGVNYLMDGEKVLPARRISSEQVCDNRESWQRWGYLFFNHQDSAEVVLIGATKGFEESRGGAICTWGDSDSPDAEFTTVKPHARERFLYVLLDVKSENSERPILVLTSTDEANIKKMSEKLGMDLMF